MRKLSLSIVTISCLALFKLIISVRRVRLIIGREGEEGEAN